MRSKARLFCLCLLALLSLALMCEIGGVAYYFWLAPRYPDNSRPKRHVLIAGDCNTNNIAPWLRRSLGDPYVVSKPPDHLRSGTLVPLTDWIAFKRPDVIYLSVGLFDIVMTKHGLLVSKEQYRKNLERTLSSLRGRTHARIIWGTLPPVMDEWRARKFGDSVPMMYEKDAVEYGRVAADVMKEFDVEILDAHELLLSNGVESMIKEDGIHLSSEGHEAVANSLSARIKGMK